MKFLLSIVCFLGLSTGAFAQDFSLGLSMVTLSPTLSTVAIFGDSSESSGTTALVSLASSYGTIESKGVNAKNELREEGAMVVDLLVNGQEVELKKFKTLSAMIADLKTNEVTRLEIEEAASKAEVSFEVMALKAIMIATEF